MAHRTAGWCYIIRYTGSPVLLGYCGFSGARPHKWVPLGQISRLPDAGAKCPLHLANVQVLFDRRDGLHGSHQHHHVFAVLLCDRGNGCRPTVTEEPVERAFWSHSVEWQATIRVPNQLVSSTLRCIGCMARGQHACGTLQSFVCCAGRRKGSGHCSGAREI